MPKPNQTFPQICLTG